MALNLNTDEMVRYFLVASLRKFALRMWLTVIDNVDTDTIAIHYNIWHFDDIIFIDSVFSYLTQYWLFKYLLFFENVKERDNSLDLGF